MNRQEYLLGKLAEESVEVGKEALKAQQFGLDSYHPDDPATSNRDRIAAELNDLLAVALMLDPTLALDLELGNRAQALKVEKVERYYQRTQA